MKRMAVARRAMQERRQNRRRREVIVLDFILARRGGLAAGIGSWAKRLPKLCVRFRCTPPQTNVESDAGQDDKDDDREVHYNSDFRLGYF